ncbi:hypothetical protein GN316_19025 [Xylophilus sp. Kf1]|nr:hypothetical protein [Xylophilus sp. Kf1]
MPGHTVRRYVLCAAALWGSGAQSAPIVPSGDDALIEKLPASAVARRQASRDITAAQGPRPLDAMRAVQEARTLLDVARAEGDPRPAGQALALLSPWQNDPGAPSAVMLMLATVEQFLHAFDSANQRLERLVKRDPRQPQAWLTLATLRRLRGDYRASDEACQAVAALGVALHGQACLAENRALRGDTDGARTVLNGLLGTTSDPGSRNWLLTTLAEAEQRAGRNRQAHAAYASAMAAADDGYTVIAYADFLIEQHQPRQALALLARQPRSNDAVLLRLAIAGRAAKTPQAASDMAELGERFAQAALRPGGIDGHAREHALYWLDVRDDPKAALALAGQNLLLQREPIDLLIYARAARAADAPACRAALLNLQKTMGLKDRRIDALL